MIQRQAHRHGHPAQMHTDERAADVHTCSGADLLDKDRVLKGAPAACGPAAAGMGLRNGRNDLAAVGLRGLALKDDSAVEMLTALSGQIDTLLLQWRQHARQHSGCGLHAGVMADMPAHDLTAGAADHKNIPCFKVRSFEQFFRGLPCLRGKLRVIHG